MIKKMGANTSAHNISERFSAIFGIMSALVNQIISPKQTEYAIAKNPIITR